MAFILHIVSRTVSTTVITPHLLLHNWSHTDAPVCHQSFAHSFASLYMRLQLTCLTEQLRVFLSHAKFTCSGPILGIFSLLLCSFPLFLQWIFFCFHLPCSGNNKADFYLYAQMPGRSNLVGLLYISPCLLSLSFFPPCPPCFSMCHWTNIASFHTLQIKFIHRYPLVGCKYTKSNRYLRLHRYELKCMS